MQRTFDLLLQIYYHTPALPHFYHFGFGSMQYFSHVLFLPWFVACLFYVLYLWWMPERYCFAIFLLYTISPRFFHSFYHLPLLGHFLLHPFIPTALRRSFLSPLHTHILVRLRLYAFIRASRLWWFFRPTGRTKTACLPWTLSSTPPHLQLPTLPPPLPSCPPQFDDVIITGCPVHLQFTRAPTVPILRSLLVYYTHRITLPSPPRISSFLPLPLPSSVGLFTRAHAFLRFGFWFVCFPPCPYPFPTRLPCHTT